MSPKTLSITAAFLITLSTNGFGQSLFFDEGSQPKQSTTAPSKDTLVGKLEYWKSLKAKVKQKSPDFELLGGNELFRQREQLARQEEQLSNRYDALQRETEELNQLAAEIVEMSITLDPTDGRDVLGGNPVDRKKTIESSVPSDDDPGQRSRELLDGPDAKRPSVDDMKQQYQDRLEKLNQRILRLNQQSQTFASSSEQLYRDEQKLGFTEGYDEIVVHVADREADKRRDGTKTSVREMLEGTTWRYSSNPTVDTFSPNNVYRTTGAAGTFTGTWRVEGTTIFASYVEEPGSVMEVTLEYKGNSLTGVARLYENGKLTGSSPPLTASRY